jgi:hypothetical protein
LRYGSTWTTTGRNANAYRTITPNLFSRTALGEQNEDNHSGLEDRFGNF